MWGRGTNYQSKKSICFDADIFSILFDARPATQVPFLRNAIALFNKNIQKPDFDFGLFVTGTLKKILTTGSSANQDSLQDWIQTAKKYYTRIEDYSEVDRVQFHGQRSYHIPSSSIWFNNGTDESIPDSTWEQVKINELIIGLTSRFKAAETTPIQQLKMFLDFEKLYEQHGEK